MKKAGIVRFLGTNCDMDVWQAVEAVGLQPEWLWYQDRFDHKKYAGVILPGGFSYGDYLRVGALAARQPVMESVREAAQAGTPVLGICNGFQILCESGLLPGALLRNSHLRFVDRWVNIKLKNSMQPFSGEILKSAKLPVAHGDGRFYVNEDGLKRLEDQEQIWFTYEDNPNGSVANIAGIMNESKNVSALMPHPERAIFSWMGGDDGKNFFTTLL